MILLWNEKMSTERHINGLMRTHDVETQKFFEGTSVECVLVQRAKYDSLLSYEFVSANYAHHQKTIVLDMAVDDNKIDKVGNYFKKKFVFINQYKLNSFLLGYQLLIFNSFIKRDELLLLLGDLILQMEDMIGQGNIHYTVHYTPYIKMISTVTSFPM